MRVLIIGGCGYIGSHLYLHLKDRYEVDTVDLEWFGNYVNPRNYNLDFRHLTKEFLKDYESIILLAGHSSVDMCRDNMLAAFRNNVSNFLELLDKIENQKLIYASSSSVYGQTGSKSVDETSRDFKPGTYYDLTKQEIDYYTQLSDVEYYGLRFGTVNGFSHNLRVDIMINKMYHTAANHKEIVVYNEDIYRPILGIHDLVRAIEVIIQGEDHRGVYNLASGNFRIGDIAKEVSGILKVPVTNKGNTDSYNFSIDTTKFSKVYGFNFGDTIESIVADIHAKYKFAIPSLRGKKGYL